MSTLSGVKREFQLHLFGGPILERQGEVVHLSGLKCVLLGILAYHGRRGIRRDRLMSLLWNEGTESQVRKRLSQLIYEINQELQPVRLVISSSDRFFLDVDRVEPDVEQFHLALERRDLNVALELVSKGFLSEPWDRLASDGQKWIAQRDRQFRSDLRTAAIRLWREAEQRGDWDTASGAAQVLLDLDPDDEEALRHRIRALGLLGRPTQARAAFKEFSSRRAAADSEWAPEEETETLLSRLDALARERGPSFLVGRYGLGWTPPLFGREAQMHTLGRILRQTPEQDIGMIGILGGPGVGKTRLAEETLRTLPFDGVRVLSGRCSEFGRTVPLAPLGSCLRGDWVMRAVRKLADPWRTVLFSVFPEWYHLGGTPPAAPEIDSKELSRRLCECFRQLFVELVRSDPLVLFIDDLHWADDTTLSVLDYIRQRGVGGGLQILVTLDEDLAISSEPTASVGHVSRWLDAGPCSVRFPLSELEVNDALALAAAAIQQAELEVSAEHVVALSGRSPLLILETVSNWHLINDHGDKDLARLPASMHRMATVLTSDLSKEGKYALHLAAVARRPIPATELIDHLRERFGADAASSCDALMARRLLRLGEDGFSITSDILGWFVRDRMPKTLRIDLNRRFCDGLFSLAKEPLAQAHFAEGSHQFQVATEAYRLAAKEALRAGAGNAGVSHLRRALECAGETELHTLILADLAEALFHSRMIPQAIETLQRSSDALRRIGEDQRSIQHRIFHLGLRTNRANALLSGIDQGLWSTAAECRERGFEELAAQALELLARLRHRRSDSVGVLHVVQVAEAMMEDVRCAGSKTRLLLIQGYNAYFGDPDEGLQAVRHAAALSKDVADITLRVSALNRLITLLGTHGLLNSEEGHSAVREAGSLAEHSGDLRERCQPAINEGVWLLVTGAFDRGLALLDRVANEPVVAADPDLSARVAFNQGLALLRSGDPNSAITRFREAQEFVEVAPTMEGRFVILAGLGWAYVASGRLSSATAILEELDGQGSHYQFDPGVPAAFRARYLTRCRRYKEADDYLKKIVRSARPRYPIAAVDLTLQRMRLLGSRLGSRSWEEHLHWADDFCSVRKLHILGAEVSLALKRLQV